MSVFYADDQVTLLHGDSLEVARTLKDSSVDCIVTSPPYYGLRDYGNEGQYGLEESPAEYVATMRDLFQEIRRVLAYDGTLWLNLGDSYGKKQLQGIPWRVALALQDLGWILRNDIIWHKRNAMPTSVTDRMTSKHEHLFMFSKSPRYWFDLDPIREAPVKTGRKAYARVRDVGGRKDGFTSADHSSTHANGKNPGDVWDITNKPFPAAHFATMPPELAARAVLAGCKPGGVVLDPFSGAGTTGMVTRESGRRYIGIDISEEYLALSLETRLQNAALDFGGAA